MSNIDYKAEVLAHNPAYFYVYYRNSFRRYTIRLHTLNFPYTKIIGASCINPKKAWQSAYLTLKKEGKII